MYGNLKTMIILILSCAATLLSAKYVVFSAKFVSVSTFWLILLSQLHRFCTLQSIFYNIDTERISIKYLIMTFSYFLFSAKGTDASPIIFYFIYKITQTSHINFSYAP